MKSNNKVLAVVIFLSMVFMALTTVGGNLQRGNYVIVIKTLILYMIIFKLSTWAISKIQGWINIVQSSFERSNLKR